jgi:hypothetical protein
MREKRVKRVQ